MDEDENKTRTSAEVAHSGRWQNCSDHEHQIIEKHNSRSLLLSLCCVRTTAGGGGCEADDDDDKAGRGWDRCRCRCCRRCCCCCCCCWSSCNLLTQSHRRGCLRCCCCGGGGGVSRQPHSAEHAHAHRLLLLLQRGFALTLQLVLRPAIVLGLCVRSEC